MENFYDFMSSALPWLCMGLLLAVFFAISANKKDTKQNGETDSDETPADDENYKNAADSIKKEESER